MGISSNISGSQVRQLGKSLGITKEEELDFYKEFWVKRKFKYVKFIGELEQETNSQKYLNITKKTQPKLKNHHKKQQLLPKQ